jgi:hypothetical protein
MAQFSISAIEPLEYDFTGIRSNSGDGYCKGKGTIPEPTEPLLRAYGEALRTLYGVEEAEEVEEAIDAEGPSAEERHRRLLELTAELCQQSPSADELQELPPRACNLFMKWVYKELSDPEVSSAGTRR